MKSASHNLAASVAIGRSWALSEYQTQTRSEKREFYDHLNAFQQFFSMSAESLLTQQPNTYALSTRCSHHKLSRSGGRMQDTTKNQHPCNSVFSIAIFACLAGASSSVSASGLTISPSNRVYEGTAVTIGSSCPEYNAWVAIYRPGNPNTQFSAWKWCGQPLIVNLAHGKYEARLLGGNADGDWYDDVYSVLPFEVLVQKGCRDFTSQAAYQPGNISASLPTFIPSALRTQIANAMQSSGAYMQLKGNWCFRDGASGNRVSRYTLRPLESAVTGSGFNGLFFKVKNVSNGTVYQEGYGTGTGLNQATRYRIAQTKTEVYLYAPISVSLPVPGTNGQVFEIKGGTEWKVYDLVMDTLLTGEGNATCAGTQFGPCSVPFLGPITPQ